MTDPLVHNILDTPVPCPVCGDTGSVFFAATMDRTTLKDQWSLFPVRRCMGPCGCLFVAYPDGWDTGRIYEEGDLYHVLHQEAVGHRPYAERFEHDLKVAEDRIRHVGGWRRTDHIGSAEPDRPWMIDVGCSNGALPCRFSEFGWNAFGCDISPYIVEKVARPNLERYGVDPDHAFVHDAGEGDFQPDLHGRFDIVQCNDVIEHLSDPVLFAARLRRLLARYGLAFFDTPDFGDPDFARQGMSYRHVRPVEHVTMLDEWSLRDILSRAGYHVIDVYRPIPGKVVAVAEVKP